MCYSQFIEALEAKKITYTEETDVDIEYWMEEFIKVIPIKSRLKPRYFSTDGGCQLF